ncbi:MAG: FtsL-like putative cell division protein [Flavobacteriaceae bacterium]
MSLKEKTYNVLKGKFLVDEDALKNWVFIMFLTVLALAMISSSHRVDRKVQKIAKLTAQQKELRALHIATRSKLMKLKMETSIVKSMEGKGLFVSNDPPVKIKINKKVSK